MRGIRKKKLGQTQLPSLPSPTPSLPPSQGKNRVKLTFSCSVQDKNYSQHSSISNFNFFQEVGNPWVSLET